MNYTFVPDNPRNRGLREFGHLLSVPSDCSLGSDYLYWVNYYDALAGESILKTGQIPHTQTC